jgi:hypothetical protein
MSDTKPNPGSPEAVEQGCQCPVMDNHQGAGIPTGGEDKMFWIAHDCPIHGAKRSIPLFGAKRSIPLFGERLG